MTESIPAVYSTDLPGLLSRGKVRDIYDLGERLLIVASDRISAFDVVMDQPVPGKGVILTEMSRFWLERLASCTPHHLDYIVRADRVPAGYEAHAEQLRDRSMVVKRAEVLQVECVVRGYLVGGGWREYRETGRVSGIELSPGLEPGQKLPELIFTPSTKAQTGHDEPISYDQAVDIVARMALGMGPVLMAEARERSMAIYEEAARFAESRGIVLADTKFEFGLCDGELVVVDEVLTPDSSRFWPAEAVGPGLQPPSFDKQFLRDYLETLAWNKQPPPPQIPDEIVSRTRARYLDAYRLLTGESLTR
ncbi:MAG: phosphoribosylaminoimidazolesuccinocarboxamide synthase [Planctomycetes bacterium]|nr:phosphoribosylaminoimidazolesuccinocarboxamide synthase [Planctomycetota bacterium]